MSGNALVDSIAGRGPYHCLTTPGGGGSLRDPLGSICLSGPAGHPVYTPPGGGIGQGGSRVSHFWDPTRTTKNHYFYVFFGTFVKSTVFGGPKNIMIFAKTPFLDPKNGTF